MKITKSLFGTIMASFMGLLVVGCTTVKVSESVSDNTMAMTHVDPSEAALNAMFSLPKDEPIHMLNMIRLRDKAVYPAGSEFAGMGWTGAQAYAEYRRHAGPAVARVGGKSIYAGKPQLTLIGPEDEQWDSIFIIYYSDVGGLLALNQDPEFQKNALHRKAGVADSRLIRLVPSINP